MAEDMEKLYNERMKRYLKANHRGKPDKVPFRPFAAEAVGAFYGLNAQQVTHDVDQGLDAIVRMCKEFDIDATVSNMVYVWTGLTESYGTKYYGVPGIDLEVSESFQYREPRNDDEAWMRADEYDRFIEDPVEFTMKFLGAAYVALFRAP